ncbi:MAG UNVERIFIED_CONTAM: polysaccharide deacetylase family protein [Microcystis novacekii LVE1205-3]
MQIHNREKASRATPVKATFFLITGHLQPNSTLIERLIAQGHEIANHGTRVFSAPVNRLPRFC